MPEQLSLDSWVELYSDHLEEWSRRFTKACDACKVDGIIVFSGTEKQKFRDDSGYPFFVEPYFKAWLPLSSPNSALKILPGETPLLVCAQKIDFWYAPLEIPVNFWTHHFEIRFVESMALLLGELGGPIANLAAIGEDANTSMGFSSINDAKLLAYLDFYRAFKTPYEVACIEESNRISATGHAAVQTALTEEPCRRSEFDLNQIYCSATQQREADLPYQNIVALNEHASILHYQNMDRTPPEEFRSFLLDAGAEFNGYASDVTRTHSSGLESFDALISSMDTVQKRLCAGARSGVSFVALNDFAHRLLADVLEEHKIVSCGAEDSYNLGITKIFLPHGLGHLLGLQVHDAGGHLNTLEETGIPPPDEHPFLRLTRTLEPGFVITIEPGLYFIPSLLETLRSSSMKNMINWNRVDVLMPYGGIRIEDNILVTDTASRNLSRPALLQSGVL